MSSVQNISEEVVIAAITAAKNRIVYLAPGITIPIALVLKDAWKRLDREAISVILDVDPEVIRLGYGTEEGLEKIQGVAADNGQLVATQPGVRICVLVSDDTTLVYTPTPLLIEAGSKSPDRPNGVRLGSPPRQLADDLGAGEEGQASRTVGIERIRESDVAAVKKDLESNPPLKFDIARKQRVFNSQLEFVEFELEGVFISRHTITIPPDLIGLARKDKATKAKLRNSYRLVEKSDIKVAQGNVSEKSLQTERNRIAKKYLRSVSGHGSVILRANKEAFEADVKKLRTMIDSFKTEVETKLGGLFEKNAKTLTAALLPSVQKNPPDDWTGFLGPKPKKEEVERTLHQTLLRSFGPPEALIREMKVSVKYKGVTYETLNDPDFVEKASSVFPNLKLLEEYDAARGESSKSTEQSQAFLF